jgi:hypothetical protein
VPITRVSFGTPLGPRCIGGSLEGLSPTYPTEGRIAMGGFFFEEAARLRYGPARTLKLKRRIADPEPDEF